MDDPEPSVFEDLLQRLVVEHDHTLQQLADLHAENIDLRSRLVSGTNSVEVLNKTFAVEGAPSFSPPETLQESTLQWLDEDDITLEEHQRAREATQAVSHHDPTDTEVHHIQTTHVDANGTGGHRGEKGDAVSEVLTEAPVFLQCSSSEDDVQNNVRAPTTAALVSTSVESVRGVSKEVKEESPLLELIVSLVLLANILFLALGMQCDGVAIGYKINFKDYTFDIKKNMPYAVLILDIFEAAFVVFYTLECAGRIYFLRRSFFQHWLNWIDVVVLFLGYMALVLEHSDQLNSKDFSMDLLRLAKLSRGLRLLRFAATIDSLHLLLKSIGGSAQTLCWSLLLLSVVQCIAAMVICQLVRGYIEDTLEPIEARHSIFSYYGTFTRSLLTMFEICLANWAPACRILVNNVGEQYGIFFLFYRCVVGFAVLNVISAVFVQQTIKVAQADQDVMIMQRMKAQEDYTTKLKKLFLKLDKSGDGNVTEEEFSEMLAQKDIRTWMSALEIDYSDMRDLFMLLDDGDGEISIDEFVMGATRVKGQAKGIDMAFLIAKAKRIEQRLDTMCEMMRPSTSSPRTTTSVKKTLRFGSER